MFYLIHISTCDTDLNLRYACILAATGFSWLTLIIKLITARAESKRGSDILFNATDGNLIRIAMLFTLLADYFFVAADKENHIAGVTVFLGTQFFIC